MSKACDFLKECGTFFVLTNNGEYPAGRPFGIIMEDGGDLFFATHDGNQAHKQLRADGHIQIVAKKEQSYQWLRITGIASECSDMALKQKFIDESSVAAQIYGSAESEHFLMFRVKVENCEFKEG